MELNKEFWLKVKEEYLEAYSKNNDFVFEMCMLSRSFYVAYDKYKNTMHSFATRFLELNPRWSNEFFVGSSYLFVRKTESSNNRCEVRKEFINWCIINSK